MIYVGIDVAKAKHDCCIITSDGEVICKPFTVKNNIDGFDEIYSKIKSFTKDLSIVKVGLEATGHFSINILNYLYEKGLKMYVFNPLHTNFYRKSLTLRKTKTDKIDCKSIAYMLLSNPDINPYAPSDKVNIDLKSLCRYRFVKVKQCSKLKVSIKRLVTILFPELENYVSDIHINTIYELLKEYPGASYIAKAHLTKLTNLLSKNSRGKFAKLSAIEIRNLAKDSVGIQLSAKSLELKQTIQLTQEYEQEIKIIEQEIKTIMDSLNSPIITIPGINYRMGAVILSEIGSINQYENPDKVLAFAGLSPTTYQSGTFNSPYAHMEKRGSKYLRYALFNSARYICNFDSHFNSYLAKKLSEGKHYNVAITHVVRKLVRVIFVMLTTGEAYKPVTI